jgi:hypothetical protein
VVSISLAGWNTSFVTIEDVSWLEMKRDWKRTEISWERVVRIDSGITLGANELTVDSCGHLGKTGNFTRERLTVILKRDVVIFACEHIHKTTLHILWP